MKKIIYKICIWLVLAIIVPVANVLAAEFSFTPNGNFEAECPVTIDIFLNTEGETAGAADAIITYNADEITIEKVIPGNIFNVYLDPDYSDHNILKYTAYSGTFNGQGIFARLKIKAKPGVSRTTLGWQFTLGDTHDSNVAKRTTSQDILTSAVESTYTFFSTDGYCADDTKSPTLSRLYPASGSFNQPLNAQIKFRVIDDLSGIDITTLIAKVTNNGVENVFPYGSYHYTLIKSGSGGENLVYDVALPSGNFVGETPVYVTVTAKDMFNNVMDAGWSFNHPAPTCEELGCFCKPQKESCSNFFSLLASPTDGRVNLQVMPELVNLGYSDVLIARNVCPAGQNFAKSPSEGTMVYNGPKLVYDDLSVKNDVQYCYTAFAYTIEDGEINYSPASYAVAKPSAIVMVTKPLATTTTSTLSVVKDIKQLTQTVVNAAKPVLEAVDNPVVEQVAGNYVAPASAAVVTFSTLTAVPWWSFLHYLQIFFTEPFAWLMRKKKKGYGVVYNSVTKEPIDLALVRLYDFGTNKLIKSTVTDKNGRYNFLVGRGSYKLEVVKPNFRAPSELLTGLEEDGKFVDLYHGGEIKVENERGLIVANIPIDQGKVKITDKQAIKKAKWQKIKKDITIIGPVISVVSLFIAPTTLTVSLTVLHIGLFFLFRRLAENGIRRKPWGVVSDKDTKKGLAKAVVRIFSPKFNRMLDVQVTDSNGRYGFLAGHNIYYITAAKDGYEDYKSQNIDLTKKSKEKVINEDIALKKLKNGIKPEQQAPVEPPAQPPAISSSALIEPPKSSRSEKSKSKAELKNPSILSKPETSSDDGVYRTKG